jgi:hypothetical protein
MGKSVSEGPRKAHEIYLAVKPGIFLPLSSLDFAASRDHHSRATETGAGALQGTESI